MKTVILYNGFGCMIVLGFGFLLRKIHKSTVNKNLRMILKILSIGLIVCTIAAILFLDLIAAGVIGPVPN